MFNKASNIYCILTVFLILFSSNPYASAAVPGSPAGLTAIAGNSESSLTWGAVPGATRYLLYRGTASGGPYSFVAETEGTGYADHGLSNGSTYYYVVTALNADGQSSYSSQINVTPMLTVLPAPAGLTALPGNGEVSLSWSPVTSAVSYNIYRATSRGGPYTLLTPSAPGPSFTDRGLTNGTSYFYVAQTTMSTNAGAYSDEVFAIPSALLPVAPATFTATPGSGWASLSWSASEGATAFLVYRGTKIGGPYSFVALPNTNTYEDFELFFDGISYYYVVAAVNASGRGAFSDEAGAAVSANEKPHATVLTAHPYDKQVHLSWSDSVGAVSYTVHRGTTPGGPYTNLGTARVNYLDTDLVNGATYYYVVDAHNASPTVVRSNEVAVTPAVVLPPPPPTNVAVIVGNTQATVTWDPVGGLQGYWTYVVTIAPAPDAPETLNGYSRTWTDNGASNFTAKGLTNGQAYYFRVQSATQYSPYSNDSAYSAYSTEVSATPAATLPLAPTNIVVDPGNRQLSLTWPTVTGAASYKVYRRTEGSAWSSTPIGSPMATLFTDTGLANGTKYYYSVAAVNADGTGAWSAATYGTPTAIGLPAPTNLAVIAGNTQATVTWDPVVGTADYLIAIATSPGGGEIMSISGSSAGGKPSFTAKDLTNGQTYYFRVRCNKAYTAYSAEVSATPATTLPLAPTDIVVAPGNSELSLTWPTVPGAASYKVYRRTDGSAWSSTPIGFPKATLFTDTGLANGTKYYYSVAAVNADGTGAWSAAAYGTPTVVALPAPTNVAVIAGNQEATITWDSVVAAGQYLVTIATSPGGPYILGNYTGGKPNYTSTSLTNGQTYYFRVQSQPPGGQKSAYSTELSVIPNPATNIGNISGHISVNFAGFNNLAVQNATVSLQGTSYTASSDANGNFTLSNIPYGNYGLLVTAPNMDTVNQDVSLTGSSLPVTIPPMIVSASLKGDANGDNHLNLADVIYLLQILIGERP